MHLYSHRTHAAAWTLVTLALCALNLWNNGIYLPGDGPPSFYLEKDAAFGPAVPPVELHGVLLHLPAWWRTAFVVHVATASLALACGAVLCFPRLLRFPRAHRVLGYVYVNAVLWVAAPSGLVLALVAKGGALGTLGFAVPAALWWWFTWSGLVEIRAGRVQAHVRQITRSYALALSAPAFRVLYVAGGLTALDDEVAYLAALYLSTLASFWLSESWIRSQRPAHAAPSSRRTPRSTRLQPKGLS